MSVNRTSRPFDVEPLLDSQSATYGRVLRQFRAAAPEHDPYVSVVIPAFNEERRILPTLFSIIDYFQAVPLSYEVIVVDDGSVDATTTVVHEVGRRFSSIRLICLPTNMGKGAAVRTGVRSTTGQFILMNDADGATPIAEIARLLAAMEDGTDLAIGSRARPSPDTRVERKLKRAIVGRTFARLVNTWVVPGIADTQCGFKLFRRHVAHRIFGAQQVNGFAFDVEVLRLAMVMHYRVAEVPINWADVAGSKVELWGDSWRMLWDVLRIRYLVPRSLGTRSELMRSAQ